MTRIDPAVILENVRAHVIAMGLASVAQHETRPERKEGCLEGFRIAGALALHPECWAEVLQERQAFETGLHRSDVDPKDYWRYRCATLQIEWVRERLRVVWAANGLDGGALISVRATLDVYRYLAARPAELRRSRV